MRRAASEEQIHPIRDRYADLIRRTRRETGRKLHAAQTVTVTGENFHQIPTILEWILDNVDAFRMISFQPVAEVGRTRDRSSENLTLQGVWGQICAGLGRSIYAGAMHFGHSECTILCPLVVMTFAGRNYIIESVREGDRWDLRMMNIILKKLGGFSGVHTTPLQRLFALASLLMRNPSLLLEASFYALYRLWSVRCWLPKAFWQILHLRRVRIRPLVLVVHEFMSPEELDSSVGRERLRSCAFKVPVNGEMISMCEMNATPLRRELNEGMLEENPIQATSAG